MKARRCPAGSPSPFLHAGSAGRGQRNPERLLEFDDPLAAVGLHRHHRQAELFGEQLRVEPQAGLFRQVDHVQRHHHRQAELRHLEHHGEMPLERRGIDHANHQRRAIFALGLAAQHARGDLLVRRCRGLDRVAPGRSITSSLRPWA